MEDFKRHKPMFYHSAIEPFLEPFKDWLTFKAVVFFSAILAQVSGFWELFETEWGYIYLLGALMVLDALGKTVNVVMTQGNETWDFDRFVRKTLYKGASYAIVITGFIMFSNQFESDASRLEYGAFLGLSVIELFSIARHFKLVGYLVGFFKQVASGKVDFQELKKLADDYALKQQQTK